MKRRELEKRLSELGWFFKKHGGEHDHWTNGSELEYIPRHRELDERLARKILRTVRRYPGKS